MDVAIILGLMFASAALLGAALLGSSSSAWSAYSTGFATTAESNLKRAFLFADGRKLFAGYVVLLVAAPAALWLTGQPLVFVALAIGLLLALPRVAFARMAARRAKRINEALPDALAQISGAMRAGATFTSAMQSMVDEQTGPLGQEFSLLLREQRLGARLEDALDNLGERVQTEEMDLVISAAMIAQEVGGNLAEILSRLSETLRRKLEMEGKIRALTAQGILQGRVVTALPFLILGALLFIEPEAIRPLWTGLLGWCFLGTIFVLQFVGGFMIRRIVRIEI